MFGATSDLAYAPGRPDHTSLLHIITSKYIGFVTYPDLQYRWAG